jgi:hypothetical protein
MFKTIINEYEQKNSYFFKIPNIKETMHEHLHFLFPTVTSGFKGQSMEMEDLLIKKSLEIDPNLLKGQKTKATKNYLIQKVSSNSFLFEKIMEVLKIKDGKNPSATQWEEVIAKRGNYELATGYNYQANYIGMKIAMKIREISGNYQDEFKLPDKISLNPNWSKLLFGFKKIEDTSKTDIILGDHKISLKKKGESQVFSGGKAESYAILTYALNKFIDKNEEGIIKKIDDIARRFENDQDFKQKNKFSAYLLANFKWSDNVKKFIETNKETFKKDVENKATVILKAMSVDYFKTLQKTEKNLDKTTFTKSFVDNIQKLWYDNLDDMKILEDIARNTDKATDEEIFQVEKILSAIRSNYRGDSTQGEKEINKESLNLIKRKMEDDYDSKLKQYKNYVNTKKQLQISTKILNDVFTDNPEIKLYMIYEAITGDFKFDKNIGAANHLCSFNTENGEISYNFVDMAFIESIKDKFNIVYTFKSKEKDVNDNSKAALRIYYTTESDLLSFHMINENFVQFLKNKYRSFSRALVKILLSRIKKIFKKAGNKIKILTKLFRSEINKESIEIKESYL